MAVQTWTVDELCAGVGLALADAFPDQLWVRGEIQGLHRSPAGHLYFDLIEPGARGRGNDAKLGTVAFRGPLRGIEAVLRKVGGLKMEDGIEVRIRGTVDYYPPQGRVQFMMNAIDPRHTLGQLAADKDAVMRALDSEGLVEANTKCSLSLVPLRIGLVTSEGSAAHHDFIGELTNSGFAFDVIMADTRVQGVGADALIANAIRAVASRDIDVVAVVRGGGAKSDLIAFDQMAVARAIVESRVPVFVGVGHEIDRSVADEVAHTSVKTPTACAGALIERVKHFLKRLDTGANVVAQRTRAGLTTADHRLNQHAARIGRAAGHTLTLAAHDQQTKHHRLSTATRSKLASAHDLLQRHRATAATTATFQLREATRRIDQQSVSLRRGALRPAVLASTRLDSTDRVIRAIHPRRTLELGYSITRTTDGKAVKSTSKLAVGASITTEVADGIVDSTVTSLPPFTNTTAAQPENS